MRRLLFCAALCLGYGPTRAAEAPPRPGTVYDQANGHFRKGSALVSQKNFSEAAREFETAARLNPKFGAAYYWLGICDFERNDSPAAIIDFKAALVNTRDTNLLAVIHYDLGVQYLKTGDRPSADAEYRSSVLLNPALARHPMAAPPPAVAPAPAPVVAPVVLHPAAHPPTAPATTGLVWVFAASLVILMIAIPLAASRIGKAVGRLEPGAVPPLERDELLRRTASWSPEPELVTTLLPRPLEFVGSKRLILIVGGVIAGLLIAARPFALIERWIILDQGTPGTATVQRKYQTTHYTKHGHYYLQHLVLAYSPAADQSWTADAVVGDSSSISPGQALPIHYLSRQPGWAVLDDDIGYSSKQGRIALISTSFIGSAFALGLILTLPGLRKERALLRMGQAHGAYV
jgi:tetratricopeptide (TPR) repeat protein